MRSKIDIIFKRAIIFCPIFSILVAFSSNVGVINYPNEHSIHLDQFEFKLRIKIPGVNDNLSGITYSPHSDTLFAIVNNPEIIVEISKNGKVQRTIMLDGFEDTEGISHVDGNLFAVVEERDRQITFVDLNSRTHRIDHHACPTVSLKPIFKGPPNRGLEGIAWTGQSKFILALEYQPDKIYTLALSPHRIKPIPLSHQRLMRDIAGLHVLENGNILVLSDESKLLMEYSFEGKPLSSKSFNQHPSSLSEWIKQPEGVAVSNGNRLYIVSEPNELFIFQKET